MQKKNLFSYEKLCSYARFHNEVHSNSEMAYFYKQKNAANRMKAQAAERMDNRWGGGGGGGADGKPNERVIEPTVELKAECTYGIGSGTRLAEQLNFCNDFSGVLALAGKRRREMSSSFPGFFWARLLSSAP